MKEGSLVVNSLQISWICTSLSLAIISEDVHRNAVILGITLRPPSYKCYHYAKMRVPNHRGKEQLLVTVVTPNPKDLGGGLQAASAQIGSEMGKLSRGTAALGKGHRSCFGRKLHIACTFWKLEHITAI